MKFKKFFTYWIIILLLGNGVIGGLAVINWENPTDPYMRYGLIYLLIMLGVFIIGSVLIVFKNYKVLKSENDPSKTLKL